jgi:hypothetical protein
MAASWRGWCDPVIYLTKQEDMSYAGKVMPTLFRGLRFARVRSTRKIHISI